MSQHDAGKKINGHKRHLVTDTLGLPLDLAPYPDSSQDRDGLASACRWVKRQFPWLTCLFADGGYQGAIAAGIAANAGLRLAIVKRSAHAKGFKVIRRRCWNATAASPRTSSG